MEKRTSEQETPIVIDSNILIAYLRSRGLTRRILFSRRLRKRFQVVTLDYCFEETWKYRERWNVHNRPDEALMKIFEFLLSEIVVLYSTEKIQPTVEKAYQIMKPIDEKDTPLLALALNLEGLIWSNDTHLKQQHLAACFTTGELKKLLKIK
jgi:predicted nucleic acid-binding protein